jgi:hypothetical protein
VVSKISLDPLLQSHMAARTAMARAVKANLHNALTGNIDQFDISAISLDGWTDQVDDALHLLADGRFT